MDLHGDALNKIVGDMDDMESKKMMPGGGGGATITITVSPSGDVSTDSGDGDADGAGMDDLPPDHDVAMCKGGCAMHKGGLAMAAGGAVPAAPIPAEVDDMRLPPFMRKKKPV